MNKQQAKAMLAFIADLYLIVNQPDPEPQPEPAMNGTAASFQEMDDPYRAAAAAKS